MSVSIGKNMDTGIVSLRFDSTGRAVELMPEEGINLDNKMRMVRAEGRLIKDHIGKEALVFLQELGKAICDGDPNTIADMWVGNGSKIVEKAIKEGMLYQECIPNPFKLYYLGTQPCSDNYNEKMVQKAIDCTTEIRAILNTLFQRIIHAEDMFTIDKEIEGYGKLICAYKGGGLGVGDTATDEAIQQYLIDKLETIFDEEDVEIIGNCFYDSIH